MLIWSSQSDYLKNILNGVCQLSIEASLKILSIFLL